MLSKLSIIHAVRVFQLHVFIETPRLSRLVGTKGTAIRPLIAVNHVVVAEVGLVVDLVVAHRTAVHVVGGAETGEGQLVKHGNYQHGLMIKRV